MTDHTGVPKPPAERLDTEGWALAETITETVFELPGMRVTGDTALYEDASLRQELDAATGGDLDMPWRFFFVTGLSFSPPLTPRIGPATVLPMVRREARRAFVDDLEDRGFREVSRGRTQRTRTRSGERLRLTEYTARYDVERDEPHDVDIEGWVGVWLEREGIRLAGGAYPTHGFDALLAAVDAEGVTDPRGYRNELLDLIQGVE